MYAFGLEECEQYDEAEKYAKKVNVLFYFTEAKIKFHYLKFVKYRYIGLNHLPVVLYQYVFPYYAYFMLVCSLH